jgi:hypothetical protein
MFRPEPAQLPDPDLPDVPPGHMLPDPHLRHLIRMIHLPDVPLDLHFRMIHFHRPDLLPDDPFAR